MYEFDIHKEYRIVDPEGEEIFVFENEGNKFSLVCSGRNVDRR